MRDISSIDKENIKFPLGSREYKELVKQFEKIQGQPHVLCFDNMSSRKISKTQPIEKVVEKVFTLPYANNVDKDVYVECIEILKKNHFYKTVSTISGIKVMPKNITEFSPFVSQICAAALLMDKKGRIFTLDRTLSDGTEQFYLPQQHVEYTEDMFTQTFEELINKAANDCLNDAITIKRKRKRQSPIELLSGYVVHTAETLPSAMHTVFTVVYQIDNFDNYEIRCKDDLKGIVLNLDEITKAAQSHMMDTWLSFPYSDLMNK